MDVDNDVERIREDFPILKYKTYLNTCATGPAMLPVWKAIKEFWGFLLRDGLGGTLNSRINHPKAKSEAAKLLNAKETEICWISRVSEGLNIVQNMMDFKRGDNIVITDLTYPSGVYVWLPFRANGVEIRRIKNHDGDIDVADFEKVVDDQTKVVSITHTQVATGITQDLKAIVEVAHDHGALVVADAYQSVGAIRVNAHESDVDFLLTGAVKWLCCHTNVGILYIREDLLEKFEPTYRFYRHVEEAFKYGSRWECEDHDNIKDYDKPLVKDARKFERCVGTSFLAAELWGFHASLSYFNRLGLDNIERRVRRLSGYLIDGLRELGCKVNTPIEPKRRAGLVTYHTGRHTLNARSVEALNQQNVVVSLRYSGGIGGVRVATHFYNTEQDIDELLKIQKSLLK
jgi:selenocysteine lyase/cysteine desulfurase